MRYNYMFPSLVFYYLKPGTTERKGFSPTTLLIAGIYFVGLQTVRKYKIDGETMTLTLVFIGQIF